MSFKLPESSRRLLRDQGYCFVPGRDLGNWAANLEEASAQFSKTWADLPLDPYIPGPRPYRLRRFGSFRYSPERSAELEPLPAAVFFQSKELNPLYGGIDRVFAPLTRAAERSLFLAGLVRADFAEFARLDRNTRGRDWKVGVHQIRVTAIRNHSGHPTPEGIHRDGHFFVGTHLVGRENCQGGESLVYSSERQELSRLTLREAFDTLLIDDRKVLHSVTEIQPLDGDRATWRDILLITFDVFERSA